MLQSRTLLRPQPLRIMFAAPQIRRAAARAVAATPARAMHTAAAVRHAGCPVSAHSTASSSAAGPLVMRAAVARSAAAPLTVERVSLRAPRPEEVLVRLVATGMCHTDVAVKERGLCAFPMVLGHEGAGIVERLGSAVTGLKVGDTVLLSYASCGTCPHCLQGKPAYCFDHGAENFGGKNTKDGKVTHHAAPAAPATGAAEEIHGSFFRQSSFAQYALASMNNIVPIPASAKGLDLALLSPLGCGIQTGAGAVLNTLRPPVGSNLAIFGAGAVGLSAVMAARLGGARRVVAIDRNARRLQLAKSMGATDTLHVTGKESSKEVVEKLRALSSGGGFQFSLDTSGNPHVLRSAFDVLDPLGVCGLIGGAAPGVEVKIDMLGLLPGKQLRGVIQGDAVPRIFLPQLIAAHQAGLFPFDKMITYYSGLEQINQAISDVKDNEGTVIKPVIRIEQ